MISQAVETADGVTLALHRLPPPGRAENGRPAVLLVHGAFSSHTVWRRKEGGGLADFLSGCGFDVWLADLRHHGASPREPRPGTWRFEDWILFDAPALAARVRQETRDAPLAWIGHSSGGAVGLCWLARLGTADLTGPPTPPPPPPVSAIVSFGTPGPRRLGAVRYALAAATIGTALALGTFPARALGMGSEDEAARILADWMGWNVRGGWIGADGFDYFAALAGVGTPYLGVAGAADRLFAPAEGCREVVEAVGATRKALAVADGLSHRGLLRDHRARERCWPRVAAWLEDTP
ncbi:MAG: alpha/beta fold hydrolase [Gemmatimonadales bacterium]